MQARTSEGEEEDLLRAAAGAKPSGRATELELRAENRKTDLTKLNK